MRFEAEPTEATGYGGEVDRGGSGSAGDETGGGSVTESELMLLEEMVEVATAEAAREGYTGGVTLLRVLSAYELVLERHQIVAIEDTRHYQLLLQLSLLPHHDWNDKFAAFQAQHRIAAATGGRVAGPPSPLSGGKYGRNPLPDPYVASPMRHPYTMLSRPDKGEGVGVTFDAIDANGDGVITREEFEAFSRATALKQRPPAALSTVSSQRASSPLHVRSPYASHVHGLPSTTADGWASGKPWLDDFVNASVAGLTTGTAPSYVAEPATSSLSATGGSLMSGMYSSVHVPGSGGGYAVLAGHGGGTGCSPQDLRVQATQMRAALHFDYHKMADRDVMAYEVFRRKATAFRSWAQSVRAHACAAMPRAEAHVPRPPLHRSTKSARRPTTFDWLSHDGCRQ